MSTTRIVAFARSRAGSAVAAMIGLLAVTLLLSAAGPHRVWEAISRSALVVPIVFVCEGIVVGFEAASLRALYGPDRHRIPALDLIRSTVIMYAVAGLMPAGRPVGEAARGAMLARWTSGVRAAAAAAKQQSVLLVLQAAISVPCVVAALILHARPIVWLAIAANALLTSVIGSVVLFAAKRSRVAQWINQIAPRGSEFGDHFHTLLRDEPIPRTAIWYAGMGRLVQITQFTLLLAASGQRFNYIHGLCALGVQMVGATIGDLIPSHLGASEANFHIAASTLSLSISDALAIPILIHFVQLLWIAIGTITPLVWPPIEPSSDAAHVVSVSPSDAR